MSERTNRKHVSKRLLVAAIGVATVSYVGTQSGCAPEGDDAADGVESSAPYDDEADTEVAGTEQAVSLSAATQTPLPIAVRPKFPPVGNLVPPPKFPPVGNLVPPPYGRIPVVKIPITIPVPVPVGNLMSPPIDVIEDLAIEARGK